MSEDGIPGRYLRDIQHEPGENGSVPIADWPCTKLFDCAVYYSPLQSFNNRGGFRFLVTQWVSNDGEDRFSVMAWGVAYFDGLRHLYFGDPYEDMLGYLYYPEAEKLVSVLKELRRLEMEYCSLDEITPPPRKASEPPDPSSDP